ncbi:MAG: AAA family ATPase [Solirubrobacteraceae bacterium]
MDAELVADGLRHHHLSEREVIAAGLAAARLGADRLIAIEGASGIGKTRLLELTRALAGEEFDVFLARGAELEQQLAYGLCTQLFERRLTTMSPRERERERALAGMATHAQAALGFGGFVESPNVELHGLYWLTVNLAGRRPLLVLLDDLHYADEPSLRWLHYLIGRLDGLPALIVAATRPSSRDLIVTLLADRAAQVLAPAALSESAARQLVRRRFGDAPDAGFAAACRASTAGNPFLLIELLAALEAHGIQPAGMTASSLQAVRPRSVARSALARLARLGAEATRLTQAVIVLGSCALSEAAELSQVDPEAAAQAADDLAREGILRRGPRSRSCIRSSVRRSPVRCRSSSVCAISSPTAGSSLASSRPPCSTIVTRAPKRRMNWPSSTPTRAATEDHDALGDLSQRRCFRVGALRLKRLSADLDLARASDAPVALEDVDSWSQ